MFTARIPLLVAAAFLVAAGCAGSDADDPGGNDNTGTADGASADGNGSSGDTGSTGSDAGSAAADAGSTASDAGSAATDTGSAASDAGSSSGQDAGGAAVDAGSATDAGGTKDAGGSSTGCTKTGPEKCDGVDNDCNGVTDENTCNDGNTCTVDECEIKGGKGNCDHKKAKDGMKCSDGDACTINDACDDEKCKGKPKCKDNSPCTVDQCSPVNKKCYFNSIGAGKPCDDGNKCTYGTKCSTGKTCVYGKPVACNDKKACTKDSCDKAKGCVFAPIADGGACDDGDKCTTGDACKAGSCTSKPKCNDNKTCTNDVCNAKTGACTFNPKPFCKACKASSECDDGSPCTTGSCTNGSCTYKSKAGCIDLVVSDVRTQPASLLVGKPGGRYTVAWNVTNTGSKDSPAVSHTIHLTNDGKIDGKGVEYNLTFGCQGEKAAKPKAGQTNAKTLQCALPIKTNGTWHIHVGVGKVTGDANLANNAASGAFKATVEKRCDVRSPQIDLLVNNKPWTKAVSHKLVAKYRVLVQNTGNAATPKNLTGVIFFSTFNGYDQKKVLKFGKGAVIPVIQPGKTTMVTFPGVAYGKKATVYACVRLNHNKAVKEWSTADNVRCRKVTFI